LDIPSFDINVFGIRVKLDGTVIRAFLDAISNENSQFRIKLSATLKYRNIKKLIKELTGKNLSFSDRIMLYRICVWFAIVQEMMNNILKE